MPGIARLFTDTASVETYLGTRASTGPHFDTPASDACYVNEKRQLVRDAKGAEVVSSTTIYTALASIGRYKPGSRVTVNGSVSHVISAHRREHGPTSAHHAQITLT